MVVFLLAAGLIGAAAGGTAGYLAGGLAGATLGAGVGAIAGVGAFGVAYALAGPRYGYPFPYGALPAYGYWPSVILYPAPRLYYTTAY